MKKKKHSDATISTYIAGLQLSNGVCPFCKKQISQYDSNGNNKLNPNLAINHLENNHTIEELNGYVYFKETVKSLS